MPSLAGLQFGSGLVIATPNGGNLALDPTPQEVGVIQNVKLTIGGDIKSLFGQYQFPVDTAVGKRSIKGSFEYAQMSNSFFNQAYFGDNVTPGVIDRSYREYHLIPATPFTVTVTNATGSGLQFISDLGATYSATGVPLTLIPTGTPTAGQYTVNTSTGVYTFAAADTGKGVNISYSFSNSGIGTTLTTGNHVFGWGPIVALDLIFPYEGTNGVAGVGINLPNVRLGKLDFTTKQDDYAMVSTDFEAFAGAANNPINFFNAF